MQFLQEKCTSSNRAIEAVAAEAAASAMVFTKSCECRFNFRWCRVTAASAGRPGKDYQPEHHTQKGLPGSGL